MPIWLYCQSCKQWSKSDASLSEDKLCPLCANLFINVKPIVDSNPYELKSEIEQKQQDRQDQQEQREHKEQQDEQEKQGQQDQQDQPAQVVHEQAEANETSPVTDFTEDREVIEPEKNEILENSDTSEIPTKEERSEVFDFVDIVETSKMPETAEGPAIGEKNVIPEVDEAAAMPKEPEIEQKSPKPKPFKKNEKREKSKTSETHVIQVMGKLSDIPEKKYEAVNPDDQNQPKKRRIRFR